MLIKLNKNPSPKDLHQFGWTLIIGFALLGGIAHWKGHASIAYTLWVAGISAGVISLLIPTAARILYRLWMGWAYVVGGFMSRILLGLFFFGIITPIALIFRCLGRDALRLKKDPKATSYWIDHPKITDRSYYQRLS